MRVLMSILCKLSTCKLASFRWLENELGLQARIVAASHWALLLKRLGLTV